MVTTGRGGWPDSAFRYLVGMQERVQRGKDANDTKPEETEVPKVSSAPVAGRIKSDLDDLLDEIDDVLEENAEEFVRNYVQKGGE